MNNRAFISFHWHALHSIYMDIVILLRVLIFFCIFGSTFGVTKTSTTIQHTSDTSIGESGRALNGNVNFAILFYKLKLKMCVSLQVSPFFIPERQKKYVSKHHAHYAAKRSEAHGRYEDPTLHTMYTLNGITIN